MDIPIVSLNMIARQIPSELLHKILTHVLADSVHIICTSEDVSEWYFTVISTLCSVNFAFREIARDIAVKAFAIRSAKDSVLRVVSEKLQYLRTLSVRFQEPFGHDHTSLGPNDSSHLVQAYSLYLTATALRRNAVGTQDCGDVFNTAHELVLKALGMSLRLCELVQPKGMEEHLMRAVECEVVLVHISTSIVQARRNLEASLDKLEDAKKSTKEDDIETIETEIHCALEMIEIADVHSQTIMSSQSDFITDLKYPILQFQGILSTVNKCSKIQLDMDEHCLRERANCLVGRWDELMAIQNADSE